VPAGLPFDLPVPVRVGATTHRVPMPGGKGSLAAAGEIEIDPEHLVLMER
jgi:hypothetical protein